MNRDATLIVRAPLFVSEKLINDFVYEKRNWIICKQEKALEKRHNFTPKKYEAGESFLFLGKDYELEFVHSSHIIKISDDKILICDKYNKVAGKVILNWYKQKALEIISERINHYSKITGIEFKSIKITSARNRWGSCSRAGKLNFSFRLVMTPIEILNYVVIHELAHIKEHNHSKDFWNIVKRYDPEYKIHLTWLKKHNYLAFIN